MSATRTPVSEAPKSILIIRLSAIGDIVMASGVLPCLRAAYPNARIAWFMEAGNEELLQANPRLDRVFLWPRRRWREQWKAGHRRLVWQEFRQLRRELRDQRFDWVLDLQGLLKSAVWARLSGGRRRIGLGSKEGSQWLMSETVDRPTESPLIGKEYRHLMAVLAAAPEQFAMDMVVSDAATASAAALLRELGIEGPFAVFCPFTTRPQKHWFDERWAELAVRLRQGTGRVPVLVGGPGDRECAEAIVSASGGAAVNLCGRTRLDECAAVIRCSQLVVGVDTGMTHMGIAMSRPSVTLLGSTDPYFETGTPHGRVLYHALPCYPCYRRPTCGGEYTCMRMHTVDSVFDTVRTLLHAGEAEGAPNHHRETGT